MVTTVTAPKSQEWWITLSINLSPNVKGQMKCYMYIRLGHFIWPEQGKEKKINQGKKNQLNLVGTFNGIWEESIGININKAMDLLR